MRNTCQNNQGSVLFDTLPCLCAACGGLEALGRVVGFNRLGLYHAARVTFLVVLAGGGHRAGHIAARQGDAREEYGQ